ncbi:transporter substrate-binding domain-containing protein [Paucibacter sp. APW11]|uniref:Transporter substrate-binding domain-containing protein n=1 Tax=Roseateles aquae TaxID=3077235 RepID=A0ABU3P9M8_9BURK|nr:transporter substrate-binding domain-containing protein [Paucibacter sp. APW11]MDT8999261.1 transporter substrate-binding domain-containing protein [Paucibacter sp. APW11]
MNRTGFRPLFRPALARRRALFAMAVALLGAGTSSRAAEPALRLYTEEYAPYNYTIKGKPSGLSVEIVMELQRRMRLDIPIEVVPWARGYRSASTEPWVGLFVTARTAEREPLFQWVGPISATRAHLYARRGEQTGIRSLDDARKVPQIMVPREWYIHQDLRSRGFTNLEPVSTPADAMRMLLANRSVVIAMDESTVAETMRLAGLVSDPPEPIVKISEALLYIAFSKGTPAEVVQRWQQTLDEMKRDGSFAAIHQRWLPGVPLPSAPAAR